MTTLEEGPVPRLAPIEEAALAARMTTILAAGGRPSVFRLYGVGDNELKVELTVFDVDNFSYEPPENHVPQGLVQWYVKHPGEREFSEYGLSFRYKESWARDE